ncbi:MAG: hypothetical protein WD552_02985 [Candidatus Paceibacterota bacterium]
MIVLIVEDLPKEQEKAKKAARAVGFKPVVAGTRADAERIAKKLKRQICGIATDIHFADSESHKTNNPNGLSVVAQAVKGNIPVSVCTDINHHFCHYITDVLNLISELSGYQIPITLDSKDWEKAMKDLKTVIETMEEQK